MSELPANRRSKKRSEALGHRPGHAHPSRRRGKSWRRMLERYRALAKAGGYTYAVVRPQKRRDGRKPRDKK